MFDPPQIEIMGTTGDNTVYIVYFNDSGNRTKLRRARDDYEADEEFDDDKDNPASIRMRVKSYVLAQLTNTDPNLFRLVSEKYRTTSMDEAQKKLFFDLVDAAFTTELKFERWEYQFFVAHSYGTKAFVDLSSSAMIAAKYQINRLLDSFVSDEDIGAVIQVTNIMMMQFVCLCKQYNDQYFVVFVLFKNAYMCSMK